MVAVNILTPACWTGRITYILLTLIKFGQVSGLVTATPLSLSRYLQKGRIVKGLQSLTTPLKQNLFRQNAIVVNRQSFAISKQRLQAFLNTLNFVINLARCLDLWVAIRCLLVANTYPFRSLFFRFFSPWRVARKIGVWLCDTGQSAGLERWVRV